jgi:hypothetical protein
MLAELASPAAEDPGPAKARGENDLGDDVVTLSYEHALRAHARYQPADRRDWQPRTAMRVDESLAPQPGRVSQDVFDGDLRTASVTVRLSKAECASLHQRAAEAGLTVSAYLRSCTIEAEALRAQVKEALAGMRSAAMNDEPAMSAKERRRAFSWRAFGWLARLLPRRPSAN